MGYERIDAVGRSLRDSKDSDRSRVGLGRATSLVEGVGAAADPAWQWQAPRTRRFGFAADHVLSMTRTALFL
jgi:hypothetical protein